MKTLPTFTANIYVGLRQGYDGPVLSPLLLERVCQDYVNAVGLCVTFTHTHFIYTKGEEPGAIVGLINYPRFPVSREDVAHHAYVLARKLMEIAKQQRVTVVTSDATTMLETEDL